MRILSFSLKIMLLAAIPMLTFIGCDDDPKTATISGTITFENVQLWDTWKDSGEIQVVIFPEFDLDPPGAGWGDIPDGHFGTNVPGGRFALGAPTNEPFVINLVPGQTQYNYSIEVPPGTYSALAVGFRHDIITNPSLRTATLGVHWNNPNTVSHGIVIRFAVGGPNIINEPAPTPITVAAGDEVDIDFKADLGFVEDWF